MDAEDLIPLLDQLDDNIDDLEEVLKPLLDQPLSHTSNKLPVLDKAKLHVWTTYALESLLFCTRPFEIFLSFYNFTNSYPSLLASSRRKGQGTSGFQGTD